MKKFNFHKLLSFGFICFVVGNISAQVGIGTTIPEDNAILQIESTDGGLLIPRMTEAQRNVLSSNLDSDDFGMWVYQTNNIKGFWYFDGSSWKNMTTDIIPYHWGASGTHIKNDNLQYVGIGTGNSATAGLHIKGNTTVTLENLYSNDFSSEIGDVIYNNGNECTSSENVWHLQPLQSQGGNSTGQYAECWNSVECGGGQNQTLVEGPFTPAVSSLDISFNYSYWANSGTSEFTVTLFNEDTDSETILVGPLNSGNQEFTYSGNSPVVAGNTYSLKFKYVGENNSMGVEIDDISVTQDLSSFVPTYTFRLEDGTEGAGKVLTCDDNGNAYWADISSITDRMSNNSFPTEIETLKPSAENINKKNSKIWIKDYGVGKLQNGEIHISLDEMFSSSADQNPIHIEVQEQGECNGLFVIPDTNGQGFIVKEKNNGNSNVQFYYKAVVAHQTMNILQ